MAFGTWLQIWGWARDISIDYLDITKKDIADYYWYTMVREEFLPKNLVYRESSLSSWCSVIKAESSKAKSIIV